MLRRLQNARDAVPSTPQSSALQNAARQLDQKVAVFQARTTERSQTLLRQVERMRNSRSGALLSARVSVETKAADARPAPVHDGSAAADARPIVIDRAALVQIAATLQHSIAVMTERSKPRDKLPERLRETRTGRLLLAIPFMGRIILNLYFLAGYDARAIAAENARQTQAILLLVQKLQEAGSGR